ncbi:MAG: DsbA family protein [Acidisphaera sp.]|nr:DsbA family protein [Acidisphaera sp.]
MTVHRRTLLGLAGALALPLTALPLTAWAQSDPRLAERSFGKPDAKVTVTEFFSLTCTHCAAFSRETMPDIEKNLIDTGRVRFLYRDFPLDQVALTAAMVARSLPPERYEPFVSALFANQDRWAFAPAGGNSTEALAQMAMLAGMPRATFDATIADGKLKQAILAAQEDAESKYHIDSTPSFLCNGRVQSGEMNYDMFVKFIGDTTG